MAIDVHVETDDSGDPVLIKNDHSTDWPVELRIGEPEAGRTRYVKLTANQAQTIARALMAAARMTA